MDQTDIVIIRVQPLARPKLLVETNEGKRYISDLSEFAPVHCFPKSQSDWENISVTAEGFNLTWGTRFEVHVDQIITSAESVEPIKRQA